MTFHDEVDIDEMEWNDELQAFTYQYVSNMSTPTQPTPVVVLTLVLFGQIGVLAVICSR